MAVEVLLFPGQGAQKVGMGADICETYDSACRVFEKASASIDVDLESVCFEGPREELNRTDLCQPAILTASIAVHEAIEEELGRELAPSIVAGLSLGEYSAYVVAKAIELEDAVRLVFARGTYMQEACDQNPGTMYSIIGLDDEVIEDACSQVRERGGQVWPANYNSPGQLVISGGKEAAAEAAQICEDNGARRAIELKVAGAFHTPLMQTAAEKLGAELQATDFKEPICPVVANTSAEPCENPDDIRDLLKQQVTHPVRWSQSMQWCLSRDHNEYAELGPGRVLRGLLKRIDKRADCVSIGDVEGVKENYADLSHRETE
ncbi:MAG: ACP S-malonyltransferase [Candidatus Brocadiia bacterium]